MRSATGLVLLLSYAATTFAQCEAPVPCEDEELNRLNTTDCQTYHAFIGRGSDSGYPGHLGALIKLVCNDLSEGDSTCGYENIVYPAKSWAAGKDTWCESAHEGALAGQQQMTDYAERCPDAKLILMGYSQGGSVGLDILGGGGGPAFECTQEDNPPMDPTTAPGSHVVAAAIFGAVRRSKGQNYTVKGGKNYNGKSPRSDEELEGLNKWSSKLREWCNTGDPMCAADSPNQETENHMNYFKLYNDEAAEWIVGRAQGKQVEVKESSTSSSATATSTKTKASQATRSATITGGHDAKTTDADDTQGEMQQNSPQQTQGGAVGLKESLVVVGCVALGAVALLM